MADGHSAGQIILQLHDYIVPSDTLNDRQKSAICERLAVCTLSCCIFIIFNFEPPWYFIQCCCKARFILL